MYANSRSCTFPVLVFAALLLVRAQASSSGALDVSGEYTGVRPRHCHCDTSDKDCDCASPGCAYTERLTLTQPTNGIFQLTVQAKTSECWSGKDGPYDMDVNRCGAVLGGFRWSQGGPAFDPNAKEQEIDLMVFGNVLGFGGAPAGFEHNVIMRQNITICGTKEFIDGTCTPGQERLVCIDKFAYCSKGACANENLKKLSPMADSFSPPVTATGLNGTYVLSDKESSLKCPQNMTVYQFGAQLGLGWAQEDMRMARMSSWLPDTDPANECVSFFTACNGLQFGETSSLTFYVLRKCVLTALRVLKIIAGFDRAHVGSFSRDKDNHYTMTMFDVVPVPDSGSLSLSKCVFRATKGKHVIWGTDVEILEKLQIFAVPILLYHSRATSD